jgi:hypothetical protein
VADVLRGCRFTPHAALIQQGTSTQTITLLVVSYNGESSCRQKEARERERGAEVISSDSSYKPAVGTWGIYERPRNISETYGGGRKLTPADSATTEEEQAEFDAALKQQLLQFRQSAGLDVDPAVEAECINLTDQGACSSS